MDTFRGFQDFTGGPTLNNFDTGRYYTFELGQGSTLARGVAPGARTCSSYWSYVL